MSIPQMFEKFGESYFRDRESEALAKLGSCSGIVLATGGGSVLREENYDHLHQNGVIFWIRRDIERLPKDGRPISQRSDLKELYEKRKPRYQRFADYVVDNNGTVEETVNRILNILEEQ
jgi:shikimate dehydrogenase